MAEGEETRQARRTTTVTFEPAAGMKGDERKGEEKRRRRAHYRSLPPLLRFLSSSAAEGERGKFNLPAKIWKEKGEREKSGSGRARRGREEERTEWKEGKGDRKAAGAERGSVSLLGLVPYLPYIILSNRAKPPVEFRLIPLFLFHPFDGLPYLKRDLSEHHCYYRMSFSFLLFRNALFNVHSHLLSTPLT